MPGSERSPDPFRGFFHACLLVLGGVIALSLALELARRIWPLLMAGLAIATVIWAIVAVIRWRRNRW